MYIQRVHPNKHPWKLLEKRKRGCIQGLPKFFGNPLFSQEREKLQISNLASTFRGSIRTKAHNFKQKGVWAYPGTAQFFRVPPIISGRGKLQISNLASTFRGSIRTKAHETFQRKGSVGVADVSYAFPLYTLCDYFRRTMYAHVCTVLVFGTSCTYYCERISWLTCGHMMQAGALLFTRLWPVWPAFCCSHRLPLLIFGLYTSADLTSVDLSRIVKPSAVEFEGSRRLLV